MHYVAFACTICPPKIKIFGQSWPKNMWSRRSIQTIWYIWKFLKTLPFFAICIFLQAFWDKNPVILDKNWQSCIRAKLIWALPSLYILSVDDLGFKRKLAGSNYVLLKVYKILNPISHSGKLTVFLTLFKPPKYLKGHYPDLIWSVL